MFERRTIAILVEMRVTGVKKDGEEVGQGVIGSPARSIAFGSRMTKLFAAVR